MNALWLYLEPCTFISEDSGFFFFYNTMIQKGISFEKNDSLIGIVRKLQNLEELYSVRIEIRELEDECLYHFITVIQASGFGDFIEGGLSKPLILPPYLNLQRSVERLKQHGIPITEKILSYLHEVVIYVNGECSLNCEKCKKEFKQHLCCTTFNNTLGFTLLKNFLLTISYTGASITILGGDIFKYAELKELFNVLKKINSVHTLVTNWRNIPENLGVLVSFAREVFRLKVIINGPYSIDSVFALATKIEQNNIEQSWEVIVESNLEYEKAEVLNEQLADLNIDLLIKPFYNGENIDFFRENVFIDENDIDAFQLERQEVFTLQELNTNDFGKLIILPDGKVYANVNKNSIGDIKDSVEEVLCEELENGMSWRCTRYKLEPCSQCRFKLVCPSPSNYEMAIGKNNLCSIKE